MNAAELDILFTPLTIRGVTLRNRFVMPGMQRGFMNDGAPTAKMVDYMHRCERRSTMARRWRQTSVRQSSTSNG